LTIVSLSKHHAYIRALSIVFEMNASQRDKSVSQDMNLLEVGVQWIGIASKFACKIKRHISYSKLFIHLKRKDENIMFKA